MEGAWVFRQPLADVSPRFSSSLFAYFDHPASSHFSHLCCSFSTVFRHFFSRQTDDVHCENVLKYVHIEKIISATFRKRENSLEIATNAA